VEVTGDDIEDGVVEVTDDTGDKVVEFTEVEFEDSLTRDCDELAKDLNNRDVVFSIPIFADLLIVFRIELTLSFLKFKEFKSVFSIINPFN